MNGVLNHWAKFVNERVGSPFTASPVSLAEVKKARDSVVHLKGPEYTKKFLKDGRKWRLWIDSEDVLLITYFVEQHRRLFGS